MARPTKQGIDYFPLDCQFDDKVELYLIEKEATGLAVMITALQIIYQNEGYYTNCNKDFMLLVKKRINIDLNEIDSCINAMIERCIFDKKLYDKYKILTSSGIQNRYFDAAKRKKIVRGIKEYIIIDINDYENIINVNINSKFVDKNATKEEVKGKVKVKRKVNTPIPKDFKISDRVKKWAKEKGYERLEEHLEVFKLSCMAKGYKYIDWDSAFMNAIRNDWAKIGKKPAYKDPYASAL